MSARFLFWLLFLVVFAFQGMANTITFLHEENVEVKLSDASYPGIINYSPQFEYPVSTIFQLNELDFHFYLVSSNSKDYYLWIKDLSSDIEIDLSNPHINTSSFQLISRKDWLKDKLNSDNATLQKLHEIDSYFTNALDSMNRLVETDEKYRAEHDYGTTVWDGRSAKSLYNLAIEQFNHQFDSKWVCYSPAYIQFWKMMYGLYYQYFHTTAFKGLSKVEIKSEIETDFVYPESKVLWLHHFFRNGIILKELEENFSLFKDELNAREKVMVEAVIQKQAVKDLSKNRKIDFLFGIDIDGAMESYFARDSSDRKNVLVFWSIWDDNIAKEFNKFTELKHKYEAEYSFIHICIDAYETPEKTKTFIYQNRVEGFHLLPQQSNAFRKSNYRKALKIREFPFYVVTDNSGEVLETEVVSLDVSTRLEMKLEFFSI